MRKIIENLRSFIKEDFSWKAYTTALVCMLALLVFNYFGPWKGSSYTLEEHIGEQLREKSLFYFWYIPFYGLPYLIVLYVKLHEAGHISVLYSRAFWIKFTIILAILCLDGGFYIDSDYTVSSDFSKQYVLLQASYVIHSFITILLPIVLCYFVIDHNKAPFMYGLARGNFEAKPYVIMLGIMIPLVWLVSYNSAFLDQYPTIEAGYVMDSFGFTKAQIIIGYEILYLIDFLNVELLFRGLMVVGMTRILGKHAILPTVVVYMLLHFEKPLGESIGAIFGGYILSILALRTQSIWGGVLIHIGVAALMEVFAFWQKI